MKNPLTRCKSYLAESDWPHNKSMKQYDYFDLTYWNECCHIVTLCDVLGKICITNLDNFALFNERYHCFLLRTQE